MSINSVLEHLRTIIPQENILISEPMKKHTSFKIGGPADALIFPKDESQISHIVKSCVDAGYPYYVMGNGTNLLVRDKGIRGVVINTCRFLDECSVNQYIITAGAGTLLSKIANVALNAELTGMEFAAGIPGSLGGAIYMNAGAYGGEMKDIVVETHYLTEEGEIRTVKAEEHEFGYRKSIFQNQGCIILKSIIRLNRGKREDIKELMDDLSLRRRTKQPMGLPSAGSVFKRPEGFFAGKLIEDSGLKGFRLGGAEVSTLHAGFIVNTANATADDVLGLIEHIRNTVMKNFNVELQPEIRIIGED